jgi:hypothetical protein
MGPALRVKLGQHPNLTLQNGISPTQTRGKGILTYGNSAFRKLTDVIKAIDLHQHALYLRKIVDNLIYLLLNIPICRLHLTYCPTRKVTDS